MNSIAKMAFDITELIFKSTLTASELKALKLKHGIKKLFKDADLKQLTNFYNELKEKNDAKLHSNDGGNKYPYGAPILTPVERDPPPF